jgi:hypothetical protein
VANIDKFLKDYESMTPPQLIEHFNDSIDGDPEQRKEAELLLEGLREFTDAKEHKTASVAAKCLAAAVYMQNMCALAAICSAEAEEAEGPTQ